MAVQEQTPYIEHIANGVTTSFSLEFECKDKEHLIVLVDNVEPNVGTWSLANGSVVFGTAPADGKIISIQRNTPFRRDTNFQSYDNSLRPATINKDFDWIWYKLQELGVADWILGSRIDALKAYVDDRDDELRAYLMEEILKQGVELDQLEDYYNYLMQRLAQIAVDKGWDASFVVDGNITQHERNTGVKSLNQLRLTKPSKKGDRVFLASVNEDQNEGSGDFIATQKVGLIDNGGTIIASPNPLLFWVRTNYDAVTPEMFGAVGDGITDDRIALQKAIDSRFEVSLMPETVYAISNALQVYSFTKIIGAGVHSSVIRKIGTRSDTGFGMSYDGNYSYEIDAILITKDYVYSLRLDDFSIDRSNVVANVDGYRLYSNATGGDAENVPSGYGLFSNALAKSKIGNFESFGSEYPVYIVDSWLNSWTNIHADGCQGWTILTGTSNTFTDCWSTHTQGGIINGKQYCAYDIKGYYHNFVTVAADHVGEDGKPVYAAYKLEGGSMTIGSCGAETVHAKKLIEVNGNQTSVKIDTIFAIGVENKYRTSSSKDQGVIVVNDASSLSIDDGVLSVTHTADSPTKQCFAELRTAAKLKIGDIKLNLKISGINDNSINQVFKEVGCAFTLDSANTKIHQPADEDTFAWSEFTYNGQGVGACNFNSLLRVGSPWKASDNSEIQFRSSGTGFRDASIEVVSNSTPTADYATGALKYSALQHEFYGQVLLPTAYANTTAAASNVYISTNGQLFRSTSSLKYKENVQSVDLESATQIVENLRPVTFTSKIGENKQQVHFGFIAEEVASIDERLCYFDGLEVEGVQYDRIIPAMIRYIQQLNERVKQLENQ